MGDLYRQCSTCHGNRLIEQGEQTLARCVTCDAAGYVKVEKCVHGKVDEHFDSFEDMWCDGAGIDNE